MKQAGPPKEKIFNRYQVFVIAVLSMLQFTVVLDFMVLSPLGAILMDKLSVTTSQFGQVVSAYAFSAGISGILTAGFADKFDRKKLLLFFYSGFILGTVLCAIAPTYELLLGARIVTGLFGGVIGSVSFAIITDLFKMEVRGRVMGYVQMSFAASQVLGLPIGLMLANKFGWHSPFWMIAAGGILLGVVIAWKFRPVVQHLQLKNEHSAIVHLWKTVIRPDYLKAFLATTLLATGGFMLMPFGSAFSINNLGITLEQLPLVYLITGAFSILFGPIIGKLSDRIGKFNIFCLGTVLSIVMVLVYTHLGITPLWELITLNVILFVGISSRMIASSALLSAVPDAKDRGAFMSVNASTQQLAGGLGAIVAGVIVIQSTSGKLLRYDVLGYVVIGAMLLAMLMLYFLNLRVQRKLHAQQPV
jgi:predicted MFS family arabinose efflux permease